MWQNGGGRDRIPPTERCRRRRVVVGACNWLPRLEARHLPVPPVVPLLRHFWALVGLGFPNFNRRLEKTGPLANSYTGNGPEPEKKPFSLLSLSLLCVALLVTQIMSSLPTFSNFCLKKLLDVTRHFLYKCFCMNLNCNYSNKLVDRNIFNVFIYRFYLLSVIIIFIKKLNNFFICLNICLIIK